MSKQQTYIVGYPRIGEHRELKKSLENYWAGKTGIDELLQTSKTLRQKHWLAQKNVGIDFISSNDFSWYDSMLDTAVMLGAIPKRFRSFDDPIQQHFAMARGTQHAVAMEMTKWFNTNYHYIVPELSAEDSYTLYPQKIMEEYQEAKHLGIMTKINLIGPLTFLSLSKRIDENSNTLDLLSAILPVYCVLLKDIVANEPNAVIQFEEPILVKGIDDSTRKALKEAYHQLTNVSSSLKLIVMTYFDHALEAVRELADIPLWGIGLDFVYGSENLLALTSLNGKKLIAGIVGGCNIWKNDFTVSRSLLKDIRRYVKKEDIILSTSCSLLHVPYSLQNEQKLDAEIKSWMSFAEEKLDEVATLARLFENDFPETDPVFSENAASLKNKKISARLIDMKVWERIQENTIKRRIDWYPERRDKQKTWLSVLKLPTTTIGSFPQTNELRKLRSDFKSGLISKDEYDTGIRRYIDQCIEFQERLGLDILVHGEPERNDMVEYFAEKLNGFVFTENGWVQSYGSRCVKPPIIYGDVSRPSPITVEIISYAQSRTKKIMKGMLTGPVTILNWSFVRNDIERNEVCGQIALALSDEIADLQRAGIKIIQVDEAAFKEGYPLRKEKVTEYENWAVKAFQLAVATALPQTQIHTHMCYSEFSDIIHTLQQMDADVITIETSRSGDSLLRAFKSESYQNEIGPGVYDIHSPRVPSVKEYEEKIHALLEIFAIDKLWINPDCGLKTRGWKEIEQSLKNMVTAVQNIRSQLN